MIKKTEIWEEIKILKAGMPTMRGGVSSQVTQRQLGKSYALHKKPNFILQAKGNHEKC